MKTKNTFLKILCLVPLLLTVLEMEIHAQPYSVAEEIRTLLGKVEPDSQKALGPAQAPEEPTRVMLSPDGYLRHIAAPPAHFFPVTSVVPGNPGATARNFLTENSTSFGIISPGVDFSVFKSKAKAGRDYVRLKQTYSGLPVFAAQVIVQLNAIGGTEYVVSDISRDTETLDNGTVSTTPTISPAAAIAITIELFADDNPDIELNTTAPQLKIFDPSVLGVPGSTRLIWDMEVYDQDRYVNEQLLIDAHSGQIVRHYPLNIPARSRNIYDANNTTARPGTLIRQEGNPASNIADVNNAYDFLGDTYDFYNVEHGRDSINNSGMVISATVRYCESLDPNFCPYENAFWTGSWIYFGDGMTSDDVVAHEYTHGVTDYESDLVYENHSGAINESFSDIWGESVDLGNGAGTDTPAVRWQMGEDCAKGVIRDMKDPPKVPYRDPDRMGHTFFVAPVSDPNSSNDRGGVHTNSGVGNKLFYLLVDGETFNGYTITGATIASVIDLFYEVQTNLLTSGADYTDLYHALRQAAVNIGWNLTKRNNLYQACFAVEIGGQTEIFVDGAYSGSEDGSILHPYDTVAEGLSAASSGALFLIMGGSYDETVTFDKAMKEEKVGMIIPSQ